MQKFVTRHKLGRSGPTAFVLNVSLAGLGAIRSLGREGITVIGLDPDPNHAGFVSGYCTSRVCPHPVHEPDKLAEFLVSEGKTLDQPGILSPASDATVLFMSRYRDVLKDYFRFILPSPDVMEASLNKRSLYDLVKRAGYDHADTRYPETIEDVHEIKDDLTYPVYLKPYFSHLWQVKFPGNAKGIKVFSPDELVKVFEQAVFPSGVEVMVQSIIQGPISNVQSVCAYIREDGTPLGLAVTRKLRGFPREFGPKSFAETFHDPEFASMGLDFFQQIGYRGFGAIEFMRDERDGKLKATDLNPRWLKSINLPTSAGVNFPLIHYRDLAGENPEPQMEFKPGVRWLDVANDLNSVWPSMCAGNISPVTIAREWLSARSFPAFAVDDLQPVLREYDYGRRVLRAALRLARAHRARNESAQQ